MPYTKGEGKIALGVFVDGHDVKFVHLSLKDKQIYLHDVKTVALLRKLEDRQLVGDGTGSMDVIDLIDSGMEGGSGQDAKLATSAEGETNSNIFLELLGEFPPRKYDLVYSISEPSVYYQTFEDSFGLRGLKLKKRLIEEIAKVRASKPNIDAIEDIGASEGQVLAIIREDGLGLLDLLASIKDFIGKRIPKVPFIETSDISLMNLVRSNYELGPEEISIIVYVGSEFSRLIFMKGLDFLHFAPVISEGKSSPNIENTLYSRILLEQDSAGIVRIDRVFLGGEAHKAELKQFLSPQFAEAPIEYLVPQNLNTGELQEGVTEIVSEYAIPISSAMRVLDPKNPLTYHIDLLPTSFREGQKAFKLAWHGYLLMVLIFGITVFLTNRIGVMGEQVKKASRDLAEKQLALAENQRLQNLLDSLTLQNHQYVNALAVYDTIVPNYNRWSKVFYHLTTSVEDVTSPWIRDIISQPDKTIELTGYTTHRERIPRIANMFQKATLQSVELEEIRGKVVYKFLLLINKVDSDH